MENKTRPSPKAEAEHKAEAISKAEAAPTAEAAARAEAEHAIARAMTALSHPRRVRLFSILETAGPDGAGFEALRRRSGLTATSLRHHLRPMQAAGLVVRRRAGPNVAFRLHGRAAARAMEEMRGRIDGVRPAHRAFAQRPPLN